MKSLLTLPLIISLSIFASASYAYNCADLNAWSAGAAYSAGAKVKNHGAAFSCKVAGWCSQSASAYEPGAGWAYTNAWDDLGTCDGSGGGSSSSSSSSSTSSSSNSSNSSNPSSSSSSNSSSSNGGSCGTWSQSGHYDVGDVVLYPGNGLYYVAVHANPGYDPTVSAWFWDLTNSCSGGSSSSSSSNSSSSSSSSSSTGGGSCPVWTQGAQYLPGDVVLYSANGNYYIAAHENPGYDPTVSTWFWDPTDSCSGSSSSSSSSPDGDGGSDFASILSEQQFNQMFPDRNPFYTYQGLLDAVAFYPAFGGTGGTTTRTREVAAAMANFSHETGGLVYIEEIAKNEYCSGTSTPCGVCAPGKSYYGRGPIQLSWNYNYCAAGQALGLNLWANPDQVASNSAIAWKTALWFWMTQTGAGTMTAHNAMVNGAGFGETIRTINGALECNGGNPQQVQSRINLYKNFTQQLGVTPGNNLDC